jgi:hypothetical protein
MKNLLASLSNLLVPRLGENPPGEFVTQLLEPMGGKILRPKNWFYCEGHHGPSYVWTISKEDISNGRPYITGVRIQLLTNIKEGTGKTSKQFTLDYVPTIKERASKVINAWKEDDQGLFSRIGFEVEEGPWHIIYSFYWGNNMDISVFHIVGTTKELWNTYVSTFEKMQDFELIDMKPFE